MKKILFFARDPGGANVIIPVYKKVKEQHESLVYAKEFAIERFRKSDIFAKDIAKECESSKYEEVIAFLERVKPDIVVTGTSLNDYTERYLWKASEHLKIKSFAILDQWMNLGIRFSSYTYEQEKEYSKNRRHTYLPYKILVMDRIGKELLIKEGIEEERIIITGQPHFDTIYDSFKYANAVYGKECWNIVFVSEPISQDYDKDSEELYWGFSEKTIFMSLYQCMEKIVAMHECRIRIIIRPHPREKENNWNEVIENLNCPEIEMICDTVNDSFSILKSADVVCGMSSMFLLESVICNVPIVSIEIGLKRDNPFVLDRMGCCKSILTQEKLLEKLIQLLHREKSEIAFDFIKNASDKVSQVIEEEMSR